MIFGAHRHSMAPLSPLTMSAFCNLGVSLNVNFLSPLRSASTRGDWSKIEAGVSIAALCRAKQRGGQSTMLVLLSMSFLLSTLITQYRGCLIHVTEK